MSGIHYEFKRDFKVGDKVFAYQKTEGVSASDSSIYAYSKNENVPLYVTYVENNRATLSIEREEKVLFSGDLFSLDDMVYYEDKEIWLKQNELNELLANVETATDELEQMIELKNSTLQYNGETYKMVNREPQAGDFMVYQGIERHSIAKSDTPYEVVSVGGKLYIAVGRDSAIPNLLMIYKERNGRTKENSNVYEKVSE